MLTLCFLFWGVEVVGGTKSTAGLVGLLKEPECSADGSAYEESNKSNKRTIYFALACAVNYTLAKRS